MQVCKLLLGWEVLFSDDLCSELSLFCHLSTCFCFFPSEVLKLPPSLPVRGFLRAWKLFLLHKSLPRAQVPVSKSFVSLSLSLFFFFFIFSPTSFWGDWFAFLSIWCLPPSSRSYSVGIIPHAEGIWCIYGGESGLPVLFFCYLGMYLLNFLKRSLVFPILLFFSTSLHCSLKKAAYLSLLFSRT